MEFGGEEDHVHLASELPTEAVVSSLKGISSRLVRQKNYSEPPPKTMGYRAPVHRTTADATLKVND